MNQHNYDNAPNLVDVPTGALDKEAATIISLATGAVAAVLAMLVTFGMNLSPDQTGAIITAITAVGFLISGIVTRYKVYSRASAQRAANQAAVTQDATIAPPPAK